MNKEDKYKVIEDYYRKNYKAMIKMVRSSAGTPHNAEDVVQEAFTRALEYCKTWDPKYPFDKWFSRILQNSLRTFNKDRRAHGMVTADDVYELPPHEDPYYIRFLKEIQEDAKQLPEDQREVINLSFFDGLGAVDISRITNISPGNIRTMISRYKEEVRHKYGESLHG